MSALPDYEYLKVRIYLRESAIVAADPTPAGLKQLDDQNFSFRRGRCALRLKEIHRSKAGFLADALPQENREPEISGPEREPSLAVLGLETAILLDSMHRESPRPLQPFLIAGALVQLQKKNCVTAGAVAQIRSFSQRASSKCELSTSRKQRLHFRVAVFRASRKRAERTGSSMAPLHQPRSVFGPELIYSGRSSQSGPIRE